MTTLFVSDLHLDAARPDIGDRFLQFLAERAAGAQALYILGDLFESWVGDDDPQPEATRVANALRALADGGLPVRFMHGNRDFLLGADYARRAGFELLGETALVELGGETVLLMHGDTLCTDDHEYQAFRRMVRDPDWQRQFLEQPLATRLAMAAHARQESAAHMQGKPDEIMDVNQAAVTATLRKFGVRHLLHGHTHRPGIHRFDLDGASAVRIVLGDWYDQRSMVAWDDTGFDLEAPT